MIPTLRATHPSGDQTRTFRSLRASCTSMRLSTGSDQINSILNYYPEPSIGICNLRGYQLKL